MSPESFCYWLNGYFEINSASDSKDAPKSLTPTQVVQIKNHLDLVFNKITPELQGEKRSIGFQIPTSTGFHVSCSYDSNIK